MNTKIPLRGIISYQASVIATRAAEFGDYGLPHGKT